MIFKMTPKKLVKKALKKGYNKDNLMWMVNHPCVIKKYQAGPSKLLGIKYYEEYLHPVFKDRQIEDLKYLELYYIKDENCIWKLIGECD